MVNTFLVASDFSESARMLDYKRLGKQRSEAFQILKILKDIEHECSLAGLSTEIPTADSSSVNERKAFIKHVQHLAAKRNPTKKFGFWHHPAVRMWLGHRAALEQYLRCHILVWIERGYKNTMEIPREAALDKPCQSPGWTRDPKFFRMHRQALNFKDPLFYSKFASEGSFKGYIWP